MALVALDHPLVGDLPVIEGIAQDFGLVDRHADVVLAVDDHDGGLEAVDVGHGRLRRARLLGLADRLVEEQAAGAVLRSVGVENLPVEVVDPGEADGAAIELRLANRAHQRGVAAVAGSGDAQPFGIGEALLHGPAGTIGDVVDHFAAPLAVAEPLEGLAASAGAAEVHLQDRVAARREELGLLIEAPAVGDADRPAVGHHHHRQVLGLPALRHGDVGIDLEPVAGLVAIRLHR